MPPAVVSRQPFASSACSSLLLTLLLAAPSAPTWSATADSSPTAQLERYDALMAEGRRAEGDRILRALAAYPEGKPYATLATARAQLAVGMLDAAAATLAVDFPDAISVESRPHQLQLAYADTLRRARRFDEAMTVLDRIGSQDEGMVRVRAAELTADLLVDRHRLTDALEYMDLALRTFDTAGFSAEHADVRAALWAKRDRIDEALEIAVYGLGFRLYRIGNEQRQAGRFADAVATYDRLLELRAHEAAKPARASATVDPTRSPPVAPVYAYAGAVYRGECLLALERFGEAAAALTGPARDRAHPYCGEANRLLGDLALADDGDINAARQHYTNAIAILAQADAAARANDRGAVPEAARARTEPPPEMRAYQGWGNLEWYRPDPAQVINAETCAWYAGYQTLLAQTRRSLCEFLAGRTKAAVADLDIITRIDSDDRERTARNMPSNYLRLRDDYLAGRLYATKAELAEFSGRTLVQVAQAELLFECEQWSAALDIYTRVAESGRSTLTSGGRAYLDFARGSALVFAGRPAEAKPFVAGFIANGNGNGNGNGKGAEPTHAGTHSYWRAQFLAANLDRKREEALLASAAGACPDPSLRVDFMLRLGQNAYCRDDASAAITWLTKLCAATQEDDYRRVAATTYLSRIQSRIQSRIHDRAAAKAGAPAP